MDSTTFPRCLDEEDFKSTIHPLLEDTTQQPTNVLLVLNKCDLIKADGEEVRIKKEAALRLPFLSSDHIHFISCLERTGMESFLDVLSQKIESIYSGFDHEPVLVTRERHRELMVECVDALQRARGKDLPSFSSS